MVKPSLTGISTTWEEFFKVAGKIKRSDFVPVAFGGQNWQEATAIIVTGTAWKWILNPTLSASTGWSIPR